MLAPWLIIDGNNLIHADAALRRSAGGNFDLARRHLVHALDELVGELAERITVVFDGTHGGTQTGFEGAAVEVVFSPAHLTADSVIERLATGAADRGRVLVVSSDSLERHTVEAGGIGSTSCRSFLEEVQQAKARVRRHLQDTRRQPSSRNNLGAFFPSP